MRTGNVDATNYAQARVMLSFINLVACNNLVLVPFTFWYLRGNVERSWYNLLLTFSAFALALATSLTASLRSIRDDITAVVPSDRYSECGYSNPRVLCSPEDIAGLFFGPRELVAWPAILMAYLLAEHIWIEGLFGSILKFGANKPAVLQSKRMWLPLRLKQLQVIFRCCWMLASLAFIGVLITSIYVQSGAFSRNFRQNVIEKSAWSIGQIVGITIWAQPVLEFVQLELGKCSREPCEYRHQHGYNANVPDLAGMVRGFSHRLPKGYSIAKQQKSSTSDEAVGTRAVKRPCERFLDTLDDILFCALKPPPTESSIDPQKGNREWGGSRTWNLMGERVPRDEKSVSPKRRDSQTSALETSLKLPACRVMPKHGSGA